jgi:hypothetical protein
MLLATGQASTRSTASAAAAMPHVTKAFGHVPLAFEPNHGQTDSQVKYLARARGYTVFLTSTDAVLTFHDRLHASRASLRMSLVGARPAPAVDGIDPLPGRTNYFVGRGTFPGGTDADWGIGVGTDGAGRVSVGGYTSSPDFPTVDALQPANAGPPFTHDLFVAALDLTSKHSSVHHVSWRERRRVRVRLYGRRGRPHVLDRIHDVDELPDEKRDPAGIWRG